MLAAALVLWAAAYHTPVGALARGLGHRLAGQRDETRPLLAYYSGGLYEVTGRGAGGGAPAVVAAAAWRDVPPGRALGRGAWAVTSQLPEARRRSPDALAARYGLPWRSPEDAARVLDRARQELGSEDAAVLAAFAGWPLAEYATSRVRAEGRAPALEALAQRLPPGAGEAVRASSLTLALGTAWSLAWPVAPGTRVSSPFGRREHPLLGRGHLHTGVDLAVPEGTPVKVVADGVVRRASEDAVNGRVVIVDHGHGVTTAYCHNARLHVSAGEAVRAGLVIADSGSTGRSTGPHLHYQLEVGNTPMDPFLFRGEQPVVLEAPPRRPARTGAQALEAAFEAFGPPASEG